MRTETKTADASSAAGTDPTADETSAADNKTDTHDDGTFTTEENDGPMADDILSPDDTSTTTADGTPAEETNTADTLRSI